MHRTGVTVWTASLLTASLACLPPHAHGARLCGKKSGAVVVRDACRKKETPIEQLGISLQGPPGAPGVQGPPGAAGAPGTSVFSGSIPPGTLLRGVWAVHADGSAAVSFPVPAPSPLADADVNFAADESSVTSDDDVTCIGTVDEPAAPAGKVCLYTSAIGSGVVTLGGSGFSRYGFIVFGLASSSSNSTARGTWAYTAP